MRLPRLAGVVLAAAAAAAPVWGQGEDLMPNEARSTKEANAKEPPSKAGGEAKGKPLDEAAAAALKKKFLLCKKTGDCKPYLLEKEKHKKDKPNKMEPADVSPGKPPLPPAPAAGRSRGEAPLGGTLPGEPPEARGSWAGPAMGEPPRALPPTAEQAEVMREEAEERRERTLSRAAGAADAMRRGFLAADETAGPGPGGPERRSASSPEDARADPGAGEPRTVSEMALAARKGFAATFRDQALKVGSGPRGEPAILRADGAAASAADLARLRTALSSDPAALRRRPDFFEVLPREKFADLKRDFAARPELRATVFKDIGLTARERDFQWTASCSGLSGNCNPLAAQSSYRKGQDVAPEDLDAVWNAAQEEIFDPEEDEDFGEYTEEDRRLAAEADLAEEMLGSGRARGPVLGSLLARMGNLAREVGEAAGWAVADGDAGADSRGVASGPVGAGASASYAPVAGAAPPQRASSAVPGPPSAPEGRPAAGRGWRYVLAAAAAAGLILGGLRRKNRA